MRRLVTRALLATTVVLALCFLTSGFWLPWLAYALISSEEPVKADAIICLAGDGTGHRISKAASLAKEGYAPVVLVSGPGTVYDMNEADLAIDYIVKRGFSRELLKPVRHEANSTLEEAWVFRDYLTKEGLKRVIVVTSDYHTGRAGRTFRSVLQGIDVHTVAAPDRDFKADSWWKNRPARKVVFMEWTKTIARVLGV